VGAMASRRRQEHHGSGWGSRGDEMESEHKRNHNVQRGPTAVDLEQFRNHAIGKGYQAKHVVRQKEMTTQHVVVHDMTDQNQDTTTRTTTPHDEKLAKYLQSSAMRDFRRQLEDLLK